MHKKVCAGRGSRAPQQIEAQASVVDSVCSGNVPWSVSGDLLTGLVFGDTWCTSPRLHLMVFRYICILYIVAIYLEHFLELCIGTECMGMCGDILGLGVNQTAWVGLST